MTLGLLEAEVHNEGMTHVWGQEAQPRFPLAQVARRMLAEV